MISVSELENPLPAARPRGLSWRRLGRALAWRTCWSTKVLLFRAGPLPAPPSRPGKLHLRWICGRQTADFATAESVMGAAQEEPGLATVRLRQGETCLAWQDHRQLVAFGWASDASGVIGPYAVPPHPQRVYLYNFWTLPQYRGQGLYPLLLLWMRHIFTKREKSEFLLGVDADNDASLRGATKAGFTRIGQTRYACILRRWHWPLVPPRLPAGDGYEEFPREYHCSDLQPRLLPAACHRQRAGANAQACGGAPGR